MIKPSTLVPQPPLLMSLLGGVVATILISALIYLAPTFGFPFIDLPRLIGGIFTSDPSIAFWLGYCLFFIGGVFVVAPLLALAWAHLPGYPLGFLGASLKGLIWGVIFWIGSGLILPVIGALNQLSGQGLENPGFFAAQFGFLGIAGLLLGHLVYGLTVALITAMTQGLDPIDTLGWPGHKYGDVRDSGLQQNG